MNIGGVLFGSVREDGGDDFYDRSVLDDFCREALGVFFVRLWHLGGLGGNFGFEFGERFRHFAGETLIFAHGRLEIFVTYEKEFVRHADLR